MELPNSYNQLFPQMAIWLMAICIYTILKLTGLITFLAF